MPETPKTLPLTCGDTHGGACQKASPPRIYGYAGSKIRRVTLHMLMMDPFVYSSNVPFDVGK